MSVVWKPIGGWPNYEVSSDGQVRSLPRERARGGLLKQAVNARGYRYVGLSRGAEVKRIRVHKLVAEAFLGPCPAGQEVRHLDDDKDRNCVENLAYGTRRQNAQDAVENGVWSRPKRPEGKRSPRGPRTHCSRDHELTPENAPVGPDGRRRCRACVAWRYQQRAKRG